MVLYLAGPMHGRELWNFPMFDAEALRLRRAGYVVVSPAEMDRANGIHEYSTPAEVEANLGTALARDLAAIQESDALAVIPEWYQSEGVVLYELPWALKLAKDVHTVEEWLEQATLHEEHVNVE